MRKIFYIILSLLILLCFLRFEESFHNRFVRCKNVLKTAYERWEMHKPLVDISNLDCLQDDTCSWYVKYHVISHAGGGINGKCYTNSKEAWDYSYSRGNRVFDADLTFTSDSILVLRHNWEDNLEDKEDEMSKSKVVLDRNGHIQFLTKSIPMNYSQFKKSKIFNLYTPMSCYAMIQYMKTHKDLYIAADMKGDAILKSYREFVRIAKISASEEVLNRIIVNVYDYDLLNDILKVYPFRNVVARQHYVHPNNYYELACFCIRNNIHVVNVSSCYAYDEGIKILHSKGIRTIVAVADYLSDMKHYRKLGFTGCVSNWLYEDIWPLTNVDKDEK